MIIKDVDKIHNQLLKQNTKQLTQAKNTPLATGELADALKWDGTGDLGRDILSGDILNKKTREHYSIIFLEFKIHLDG